MDRFELAREHYGLSDNVALVAAVRAELSAALARALSLGVARDDLRALVEEVVCEEKVRVAEEGDVREC